MDIATDVDKLKPPQRLSAIKRHMKRNLLNPIALPILSIGIASCASVSVHQAGRLPHTPPPRVPQRIYIQNFATPAARFRVDRAGEDLDEFRAGIAERLTRNLVWRIRERITYAYPLAKNAPLPVGPYWLVTGTFDRVNQGSRALRMGIGLGAGGTKVETTVIVHDLSQAEPRPFLSFRTTGGTNAQAGAIFNPSFWGAAFSGFNLAFSGVGYDTIRTSREITATLSDYLAQEGAIDAATAMKPKKLGQWP